MFATPEQIMRGHPPRVSIDTHIQFQKSPHRQHILQTSSIYIFFLLLFHFPWFFSSSSVCAFSASSILRTLLSIYFPTLSDFLVP